MISVLIANPKGGCGKTTIATNLAAAFANWGLATALADTDLQHSCLDWLAERPDTAANIRGLDWSETIKKPPKNISRLVIDSAASLDRRQVRDLVRSADIVVIPLLPSAFDLRATTAFLESFTDLKPIRKGRKPFALVRNRCRAGSTAVKRLEEFLPIADATDAGWLSEKSLYNDVAWKGLSIFDLRSKQALEVQREWAALARFIENQTAL